MRGKVIIKPKYFKRLDADDDTSGRYTIFLQHIDEYNKGSALEIVERAGGVEGFGLCSAWFQTKDLPALCKTIEKIANRWYCGHCGVKCDDKDKSEWCLDDESGGCGDLAHGGRNYFDPENKDDVEKMHINYGGKQCFA